MDIGPISITRKRKPLDFSIPEDIDEQYAAGLASGKRLILGTLVARSGTRSLCEVFSAHQNATGITERYAEAESFLRYVTFHDLPVDLTGVIKLIKKGVVEDWKDHDISLVFSPYFSHAIQMLVNKLSPEETIIGLAEPRFTVQSIYNKGLFKEDLWYEDHSKVIGFQPQISTRLSHFFGRVVPTGAVYREWKDLTQIGRISWWGNQITKDIGSQMSMMKDHSFFIFNLPDAIGNYEYYLRMQKHFGLSPVLSEDAYEKSMYATVNPNDNLIHDWSLTEEEEFKVYAKEWRNIYAELT